MNQVLMLPIIIMLYAADVDVVGGLALQRIRYGCWSGQILLD